ncbi:MAG: hypothetical protein ACTTJK_09435 [Phocaeicola sp.]|uniref:hypothetical protein n=1 Tax=Phocaeicola sp. TaxID=2773926 RepID=UPI003F9EFD31
MRGKSLKRSYLIYSAVVLLIALIIVFSILRFGYPSHYFSFLPVIPVFFYIYGLFFIVLYDKAWRSDVKKDLFVIYFGHTVARFLLFIFACVGVMLLGGIHRTDIVLAGIAFYFFIILFETSFFFSKERREKLINSKKINKNE